MWTSSNNDCIDWNGTTVSLMLNFRETACTFNVCLRVPVRARSSSSVSAFQNDLDFNFTKGQGWLTKEKKKKISLVNRRRELVHVRNLLCFPLNDRKATVICVFQVWVPLTVVCVLLVCVNVMKLNRGGRKKTFYVLSKCSWHVWTCLWRYNSWCDLCNSVLNIFTTCIKSGVFSECLIVADFCPKVMWNDVSKINLYFSLEMECVIVSSIWPAGQNRSASTAVPNLFCTKDRWYCTFIEGS